MTDIPQFDFPFRLVGKDFAEVEQNSDEELEVAAFTILSTPLGFLDDTPEFGLDPQELRERVNVETIRQALERWDSRAAYNILEDRDKLDALVSRVRVEVAGREIDT